MKSLEEFYGSMAAAAGASIVALISWLVRRVFTNQKELDLLKQEITHRDNLRLEDSKRIEELHKDVREIREGLKG